MLTVADSTRREVCRLRREEHLGYEEIARGLEIGFQTVREILCQPPPSRRTR